MFGARRRHRSADNPSGPVSPMRTPNMPMRNTKHGGLPPATIRFQQGDQDETGLNFGLLARVRR